MTKRHFIAIAEMFKNQVEGLKDNTNPTALNAVKDSIQGFISIAAQENPRFDAARFRTACGL